MTDSVRVCMDLVMELRPLFSQDPEMARTHLLIAADGAHAEGDFECEFRLRNELAWQSTLKFEAMDAIEAIHQVLEMAERSGDPEKIGSIHNIYGVFFMNAGEPLQAVDHFGVALAAYESIDKQDRIPSVLANIGETLVEMDDIVHAGPYLKEACRLTDPAARPELGLLLAYPLTLEGRIPEVWKCLVDVWKTSRNVDDWILRANVHDVAGWVHQHTGNPVSALRHYQTALRLFTKQHDPFREAVTCLSMGDLQTDRDLLQEAAALFRRAATLNRTHGYLLNEIRSLRKWLMVSSGPQEGLEIQQRLEAVLQQYDRQYRAIRRNFVDIRIRSEVVRQERARLEKDYERDALTGLFAYRSLGDRMKAMQKDPVPFAFLFMDVDRLKSLNDRLGHAAGDVLLKSFAHDISDALPKSGIAIRKSGDEFIVLLPGSGHDQTEDYLQDLYARLSIGRRIGEEIMPLSCSAGIVLWPGDTDDCEQLEWMADQAMYKAKSMGRNHFCWHQTNGQS